MRYRSTVNRCFAETAAISLPTGDAKEESIAYARVLIEQGCSSNCRHFKYIGIATSRQALSRKRGDSHEHILECPIDGKGNNPQMPLHPKVTRVIYKSNDEEKT